MQITPLPAPIVATALSQDTAKIVPQLQAQAAAPLLQRAVDPSAKGERGNQSRSNGDKAKAGSGSADKRGAKVNIRV